MIRIKVTVKEKTLNKEMLDRCRTTVWKDCLDKDPSIKFVSDLYFSEHSPIREKCFSIEIRDIKYWIAMHLARHSIGFTPYISTQRDDRHDADIPRDELPQGALVNMDITLNAQSFINVSRKRLCRQSHPETIVAWVHVLNALASIDRVLYEQCVCNCIYRGGICPEGKNGCGYNKTKDFICRLEDYLEGHENSYRKL